MVVKRVWGVFFGGLVVVGFVCWWFLSTASKPEGGECEAEKVDKQQVEKVDERAEAERRGLLVEARRWRVWLVDGDLVEARFVRRVGDEVFLRGRGGVEFVVLFGDLSVESREWVVDFERGL